MHGNLYCPHLKFPFRLKSLSLDPLRQLYHQVRKFNRPMTSEPNSHERTPNRTPTCRPADLHIFTLPNCRCTRQQTCKIDDGQRTGAENEAQCESLPPLSLEPCRCALSLFSTSTLAGVVLPNGAGEANGPEPCMSVLLIRSSVGV